MMEAKGTRNIWFGVLGVGLALAALWGYGQMLQKDRVMARAESQYQRAFHQLIDHTVNIESRLSKLMVSTNQKQQVVDLDNVRQHATAASEVLAELPLSTVQLGKTISFYNSVMQTADALALKLLDGQPLNDQDRSSLKDLHNASVYARDELYQVSQVASSGRMRWIDAEQLSASDYRGGTKNPLVENLLRFDGGLQVQAQPSSVKPYKGVTGADVSAQQAVDTGATFTGDILQTGTLRPAQQVAGALPAYQMDGTAKGGQRLIMQVTRKGGHPLWIMATRIPGQHTLSRDQAIAKAEDFVRTRTSFFDSTGGLTFVPTTYGESENIALVTLAPKQGDVIIYPDSVDVKVAMDNGEILGFNARDFLQNHTDRGTMTPKLTEQEALAKVSPSMTVQGVSKALVVNDRGQEVLTYEVRGTAGNLPYQVFINAQDGTEELIERADNKLS